MSVVTSKFCSSSKGKIFWDKIQACSWITYMFTLLSMLNLNESNIGKFPPVQATKGLEGE
jgi:hypothetical protein